MVLKTWQLTTALTWDNISVAVVADITGALSLLSIAVLAALHDHTVYGHGAADDTTTIESTRS